MSEVLGALFALLVGMMYLPKIQSGIATERHVMTDVTTAQQQQQWVSAVSSYVSQNNATLLSTVTTTPTPISVAAVKAANVGLPVGFTGTNPFNQTWAAAVTQPSAGNLQVLIYAIGGTRINDQELGSIARAAMGVGGMIPTNNSGVYPGGAATAYGAFGAWQIPTASYGVAGGSPASLLNFNKGTLTSNYLYRNAVPGQPQLNTMSTNLSMGGNTITNAQQIQLAAGNGVQVGSTYYYGDGFNSAIRQNGTLYIQNQAGTATASLNAGNITANGDAYATGAMQSGGRMTTGEYLQVNGYASAGSWCPSNGLVGRDGTGLLLFCRSGVWTAAGGGGSAVAYCKSTSCGITLPSGGTWDISGVSYAQQAAWNGAAFWINGALVDTNVDWGDQEGTGYGVMTGTYQITVGGPTYIPAWTSWSSAWGDYTITLHATKE
ncbi:shufflon system plasmid conjugative transfer pilus tip adhesin PilV [Pandoraea cepalis]|uniref:Bacterial shufflon protein N-terminal domain-containing protein n=1 Tax=Pandoraea cepalis TaxID=2508294 RepID=A0A5E4W1Y9_9BURK|nr:shufflon system plasmid conjugative transfer pilus tip adhesin PilV [Pandoraea cepalis]VVE18937.1 hypothetical protein PCE31107_03046 [Pandoraea cepalis]